MLLTPNFRKAFLPYPAILCLNCFSEEVFFCFQDSKIIIIIIIIIIIVTIIMVIIIIIKGFIPTLAVANACLP